MAMKTKTHRDSRTRGGKANAKRSAPGGGKAERTINQTITYLQKAQEALSKLQDVLTHGTTGTRASRGAQHTPVKSASTGRSKRRRSASGRTSSERAASHGLKYAKWIDGVEDHEDRPGQSLATQNHDVIRQWAEERGAVPVTVPGTEHDHRPGVLRLNFPGYGGKELKEKRNQLGGVVRAFR